MRAFAYNYLQKSQDRATLRLQCEFKSEGGNEGGYRHQKPYSSIVTHPVAQKGVMEVTLVGAEGIFAGEDAAEDRYPDVKGGYKEEKGGFGGKVTSLTASKG